MKVIKRNGDIQDFDFGKIRTSIARASDDVKEPFTMSDVENVANGVKKKLLSLDKSEIKTQDIYEAVLLVLEMDRFYNIAKAYREGANRE